MSWKYFHSSIKGTSHIENNTEKQDSCLAENFSFNNNSYLVCAVADGAGSAKYSDLSSKFICKLFNKKAKNWLKNNELEDLNREIISSWFSDFQKVINRAVAIYKLESSRDFATTLLFAILSDNLNAFIQIGDGIIAINEDSELSCAFLPQNGEFINTTNFATQKNVFDLFEFKLVQKPIKKLAMHTDGIEQIAFDFKNQKPFSSFYVPFFGALEKMNDDGYSEFLSQKLGEFLASSRVNSKTDDDKTLLLALRSDIVEEKEPENKTESKESNSFLETFILKCTQKGWKVKANEKQ